MKRSGPSGAAIWKWKVRVGVRESVRSCHSKGGRTEGGGGVKEAAVEAEGVGGAGHAFGAAEKGLGGWIQGGREVFFWVRRGEVSYDDGEGDGVGGGGEEGGNGRRGGEFYGRPVVGPNFGVEAARKSAEGAELQGRIVGRCCGVAGDTDESEREEVGGEQVFHGVCFRLSGAAGRSDSEVEDDFASGTVGILAAQKASKLSTRFCMNAPNHRTNAWMVQANANRERKPGLSLF